MTNQIVSDGWKPATDAPFDKVLMVRFKRDDQIIEREMVRLRDRLWWDCPFAMYANESPFEFTDKTAGYFKWG